MCKTIEEGQKSFREQMEKLKEGINKLSDSTKSSVDNMLEMVKGIKEVEDAFKLLPNSKISFIVDKKEEIEENINMLKHLQNQFIESHEDDNTAMDTFYDLKDQVMEDINEFNNEYKLLIEMSDPTNLEKDIKDYEIEYHSFVRNQELIRNRKQEKLNLLNNLKNHYSNLETVVLSLPEDLQERFNQSLLEERLIMLFHLNTNIDWEV